MINSILMILAGISGGNAFKSGITGPELNAILGPYMMPIGILSIICGLIFVIFAIQIIHTAAKRSAS
ncbi:MAG: hypothetical protein M1371_04720 [Actinobacteria bacterium]|nr:hypothetical protein [Actinomycetota bacterium]